MSTTISIRNAKCKDCDKLRYFYEGKRKLHMCSVFEIKVRLNDQISTTCADDFFRLNSNYYPKRLEE